MKYRTEGCKHQHATVVAAVNCWRRGPQKYSFPRVRNANGSPLSLRDQIVVRIAYKMPMGELMKACKDAGEVVRGGLSGRQLGLFDSRLKAQSDAKQRAAG